MGKPLFYIQLTVVRFHLFTHYNKNCAVDVMETRKPHKLVNLSSTLSCATNTSGQLAVANNLKPRFKILHTSLNFMLV
jgi:hypothetical protein